MTVERELMEVAEAVRFLTLRGLSRLPHALDGRPLEQGLMPLVDGFDLEVGLVPGEVQVVLAVDLRQEELRVPPVFIEIPDDRLLIDVPAEAAQAELGAARTRSG
jgi:hypothetical protein